MTITRRVLSYGHLVFIGAIVVVAVGLKETVAEPTHRLPWSYLAFLYGGAALFLATFGYTRWMTFHSWSVTRLTAAVCVLALVPVAALIPALAAIGLLTTAILVLIAVEHRPAPRRRPAPAADTTEPPV